MYTCGPGILAGTLKPNNSQRRSFFNRGHAIYDASSQRVSNTTQHGFVRFDRESKSTEQGRTDDASLLEVCAWVGIGDWGGSRSLGGPHNNMVTVWATVWALSTWRFIDEVHIILSLATGKLAN